MKAYNESRSLAPLILNIDTRPSVQLHAPLLYPAETASSTQTNRRPHGPQRWSGHFRKESLAFAGNRDSDLLAHSPVTDADYMYVQTHSIILHTKSPMNKSQLVKCQLFYGLFGWILFTVSVTQNSVHEVSNLCFIPAFR